MRRRTPLLLLLSCLALAACQSRQSVLFPRGPQASELFRLLWIMAGVAAAIWLATIIAICFALLRRRAMRPDPLAIDRAAERRRTITVLSLGIGTAAVLVGLTVLSYAVQRDVYRSEEPAVTIRIVGHRWWWEITYADADPSRSFTTANEFRIPTNAPVRVKLTSADVIHSFWVPALMGKMDLIPGQENAISFVAAREGTYRGQCAEFCGLQHAHMALLVTAEPLADFERWRAAQIAPAMPPSDPERQRGESAFLTAPCAMCHAVRGTPAGGRVAPDLTHLGSRRTIAAGTLPMSRGNLAAWIVDPHGIKPGVDMPLVRLAPDDIDAIAAYLEGLR